MEQATKLLNDSMRDTSEAFKASAEAGTANGDILAQWNVAALTSTETGSKLYDSLSKSRTAYDTATVAAYNNAGGQENQAAATEAARAAADSAYAAFISMATAAGVGESDAIALAGALGIVQGTQIDPKVFDVLAEDQQAQASLSGLQTLQIDPKEVMVNAFVDPANTSIGAVVGASWNTLIETSASTSKAQSDIQGVAKAKYPAVVDTTAQTNQASSQIDTVASKAYRATVTVDSNVASALSSIANVTNGRYAATIQVSANTSAAANAIYAVANGYYVATIQVTANTSGAMSAIAAIPRSVGVSVTPSPAPAPAAMAAPQVFGLMSMAAQPPAPSVLYPHGTGRVGTGDENNTVGTTTIHISVSGAEDPDKTARRIYGVLAERSRRAGGVRI
jgi:hypothetical protein